MKFKKEIVLDSILDVRDEFCKTSACSDCKLETYQNGAMKSCTEFCEINPLKAASMMGFKVIEDKTDATKEIPHNIGNMTLAQAKEYCLKHSTWIKEGRDDSCRKHCELGKRHICGFGCSYDVFQWNLDRLRLTPQELEICRALGAKYISRDMVHTKCGIELRAEKPTKDGHGEYVGGYVLAAVDTSLFPSVKLGDCINVEELLNGMDTT